MRIEFTMRCSRLNACSGFELSAQKFLRLKNHVQFVQQGFHFGNCAVLVFNVHICYYSFFFVHFSISHLKQSLGNRRTTMTNIAR